MSKRQERREELARRLADGRLSQSDYDRLLARMDKRGKTSRAKNQSQRVAHKPQEWSPRHPGLPAGYCSDCVGRCSGRPCADERGPADSVIVLKVRRERKAGYVKAAQQLGKTLSGFILDASDREAIQTLGE